MQILIVVDGAYTEQPGGPFYLNIRRGYYSPLTVMTELLQRLIAVTSKYFTLFLFFFVYFFY